MIILRVIVGIVLSIAGIAILIPLLAAIPRIPQFTSYQLGGLAGSLLTGLLAFALAGQCLKKRVGGASPQRKHTTIIKRIFGGFILLIGLGILGWIAYNYLVEMQPHARGRSPLQALVFSSAAIFVGGKWLFAKRQKDI